MWRYFLCVSRPGPGDVIDEALRMCDTDGECISFLTLGGGWCAPMPVPPSTLFRLRACFLLQGVALRPSGSCGFLWACASCCHVSSCLPGPVAGSTLPTDTPGSTTPTWRWLSRRKTSENTSAHARYTGETHWNLCGSRFMPLFSCYYKEILHGK